MGKIPLILVSICAVVLLVLGSLSNVVGYLFEESMTTADSPLFQLQLQNRLNQRQRIINTQYFEREMGFGDDTIPPVTICLLNPPEPNGENGWYISKITVTLIASDDNSGVNITNYQVDGGAWQIYLQPFNITTDSRNHTVQYFSVDNAGNIELTKSITFALDTTKPTMSLEFTATKKYWNGYVYDYYVEAHDTTSGMNRTEFYFNGVLQDAIFGPGPNYKFQYLFYLTDRCNVNGFIRNREITESYVKFYSLVVFISVFSTMLPQITQRFFAFDNAGNWEFKEIDNPTCRLSIKPGLYLFQDVTLPNDYTGYLGRFRVRATFYGTIEENQ